ncbi:MAG: TlpA family protein disulfide reductase [Dysgonamonadaceae bacterium]|jgi:thiol-disulfide isomerase/thioredoxin|nr:TlpA family protein disulfide reductase [Dysgonamonadaceae bacterium]
MIKKINLFLIAGLLAAASVFAGKTSGEPAMIQGKWTRGALPEKIFLYKMDNGQLMEIASSAADADSIFYFVCKAAADGEFYYIGTGKLSNNRYAFYLKPKDKLDFTINDSTVVLNGNANSPENLEMSRWLKFMEPIENRAVYFTKFHSTYVDFFPLLEEKFEALKSYPATTTKNKAFNAAFETYKKLNFESLALEYLFKPRTATPEGEDYPDYYRDLNIADITQNADLLTIPNGIDIPERIYFVQKWADGKSLGSQNEAIGNILGEIKNDTIKGLYVLKNAAGQRNYAAFEKFEENFGKYLTIESQKASFLALKSGFAKPEKNQSALGFKFQNIEGKEVALSDLKGKLIYIDVWATWCSPCRKEIPFLKKLDADYRNKNIAFVSVSVDKEKDIAKWKAFVEKEKLTGIQLFAGDEGSKNLSAAYKITGIPRFMLFGKDGKIISPDAPRPSSADIRKMIDDLL